MWFVAWLAACHAPEVEETGETGDSTPIPAEAFDAIRAQVARDLRYANATGAQVAIWLDGTVIFSEGFGTRDPDGEAPVTPQTRFQFGSDLKKLTAIAVLQQVEAGHVALDDTLAEALPGFSLDASPTWATTATVEDLLTHRGGLYDYTPWDHDPADSVLRDRAMGSFADNAFAVSPPGRLWNYSNPNFSLAGLIVEQATGRAYADVMEDDLFAPLGMTHTHARLADVAALSDYAVGTGYTISGGNPYDPFDDTATYAFGRIAMEDQVDNAFTRPAGMVWSTAEDLVKVAAFLLDGNDAVLADALRERVYAPLVPTYPQVDADSAAYGYGLFVSDGWSGFEGYHQTPIWQHGGNTLAMTSGFWVLPEQRLAVSVLTNGYGDDFSGTAAAALEALVELPPTVSAPNLFGRPPQDLSVYAGTYEDPHVLGTLTITAAGSTLTVDAPDLDAASIPYGTTLTVPALDLLYMRIDGVDVDLWVWREEGVPTWLANRTAVAERVDAPNSARPAHRPRFVPTPTPRHLALRPPGP